MKIIDQSGLHTLILFSLGLAVRIGIGLCSNQFNCGRSLPPSPHSGLKGGHRSREESERSIHIVKKKLASLEATLVRSYNSATD